MSYDDTIFINYAVEIAEQKNRDEQRDYAAEIECQNGEERCYIAQFSGGA